MATSKDTDVLQKLAALQLNFKQQLPDKILKIKQLWQTLIQNGISEALLADVHRLAHSLAGSGGTFGAMEVSAVAREIEQLLKELINISSSNSSIANNMQEKINELLIQLKNTCDEWQPSSIQSIESFNEKEIDQGNLVYLVIEDDELFVKKMGISLKQTGFRVRHFSKLNEFEKAIKENIPAAILIDIAFDGNERKGIDTVIRLKENAKDFPPLIFISASDDIAVRLEAAKAGVHRYFLKPVNIRKVTESLASVTTQTATKPYRILIIDSDKTLLDYYTTILRNVSMEVKSLSNPLDALKLLYDFKPDVVVTAIYMPSCSGPELAQVIRQDDKWLMMPIMFLSSESDLHVQLDAMNLGGDDFLLKPVEAYHLISAVTARAKRARLAIQLNRNLKASLRESEYQHITMDQHNINSSTDITGKITSVNDKFCEISGYSRNELLGENHRILKSGYHPPSFYKDMWEMISQGLVWHGTLCNRKKNGDDYWVESTIVPFLDEDGKPYKYVSARTDITTLRQSEDRLSRSQNFANIGTWDWDIESGKLFWSEQIWNLFGYDKKTITNSYDNFIAAIHPEDRERVNQSISNCIDKSEEYNVEHRVIWPDGSIHWLNESGNVVRNKNNKPLHMLGVVQDITNRKRDEEAIIFSREEADNANRAKSQFLSRMSHELRTPMNAIMGFSQLMTMESELNESQLENITEITKASQHLLDLINDVLDLAKVEAGHIQLSIEAVGLSEVISESVQFIMPLAKKRGIEISLRHNDTTLPLEELTNHNYAVRADRTRLRQILLNLLSNAVKYNSENGEIVIACHQAENKLIRISIADSGEGLTDEQQGQLFQAFHRLEADGSEIEGTGIGLVITKNIVELMGGSIGVESHLGEGSTFWFELPSDTLSSDENNIDDKKSALLKLTQGEIEKTVLYIEDNPANLRLVTQLLGRLNHIHMWSAHEPLLGLELAAEHKPDLILLDINLPGMDGFGVLEHLRKRDGTRNIPVIAISANAMPQDIERGINAGFDDYITKPIDVKKFIHAVDNILNEN